MTRNLTNQPKVPANVARTTDAVVVFAGNVSAKYFFGNGAFLEGVSASGGGGGGGGGGTSYKSITENASGTLLTVSADMALTGNLVNDLRVSGNVGFTGNVLNAVRVSGDVFASNLNASSVVNTANLRLTGNLISDLSVNGNIRFTGNVLNAVRVSGDVFASNLNATSVVNTANLRLTGNVVSDLRVNGNVRFSGNVLNNVRVSGDVVASNVISYGLLTAANLSLTGNVLTDFRVNGNLVAANVGVSGAVTAGSVGVTGAVTAGSVGVTGAVTAGSVGVTGAVTAGSVGVTGAVTAGTLGLAGNVLTDLRVDGNISTQSGNLSARYFLGNGAFLEGVKSFVAVAENPGATLVTVSANLAVTGDVACAGLAALGSATAVSVTANNLAIGNLVQLGTAGNTGNTGMQYTSAGYSGPLVEKRLSAVNRMGIGVYINGINSDAVVYSTGGTGGRVVLGHALSDTSFVNVLSVIRDTGSATTGNVGINTMSPSQALHVVGNALVEGYVYATNDITAFSDRQLKANLDVLSNALARINRISGYTYDRIDFPGIRQAGVIAQEVRDVLPEAVLETNGRLSVAHNSVLALLVEAVKELSARMDAAGI